MKVKFITLGCKVNQYETQGLREKFQALGFTPSVNKADICVINTCTVTSRADAKSRDAIGRAKKENPKAVIAVCGCLAQLNKPSVEALGVDYVVGQEQKALLPEIVAAGLSGQKKIHGNADIWGLAISRFSNQRAFIKIQDGCDNFCTFCKIPFVRGKSRSRRMGEVIDECRRLIPAHAELVFCGVNLGLYGKDLNRHDGLVTLLSKIIKLPGLGRLRLSSLEPVHATKPLLDLFLQDKLCPHLHFPFQSGDDRILAAMHKKETAARYEAAVHAARSIRADMAISCDIMVGFPGEDEASFERTVSFLDTVKPMRTHVFSFSPREKTRFWGLQPALAGDKDTGRRYRNLAQRARGFAVAYAKLFQGRILQMIPETYEDGLSVGYTENYLRVYVKDRLALGRLLPVKIGEVTKEKIFAHTINLPGA